MYLKRTKRTKTCFKFSLKKVRAKPKKTAIHPLMIDSLGFTYGISSAVRLRK